MTPTSYKDNLDKLMQQASESAVKYSKARNILNRIAIIVSEDDHEKLPDKVQLLRERIDNIRKMLK